MHIISHPSPNFDARTSLRVDLLVLHYTGMQSGEGALTRLCDPASQVSAHYLVEEDGKIYRLVPESMRAWHAGASYWRGKEGLNHSSIGVEIVNPGHEFGYRPFPGMQMKSVIGLCKAILSRHPIPPRNVVAHSDIAPERKEDPGELFDWEWLAQEGVGLWPDVKREDNSLLLRPGDANKDVLRLQQYLFNYGYHIEKTGVFDAQTEKVAVAFKRHFYPKQLNAEWQQGAEERLRALMGM